jgi:restriction system protein
VRNDYTTYRQLLTSWADQGRSGLDECGVEQVGASSVDADISQAVSRSQNELVVEILALIHAQVPAFFEDLVIDLLLAMGYGGRRRDLATRLGQSGDGGVDGVIAQDELGLDLIYMQAKRFRPGTTEPLTDVRDFAGSLDAHHATKGIFVTTSSFSDAAVRFCAQVSRRVVLIDGPRFAELMIRHNVGVRVKQSFQVKRVDLEYFTLRRAGARSDDRISQSIQPRR